MLADERKPPEDIAAITYSRINHVLRNEIADQMTEFEKRNKITPIPMGATALKTNAPPMIQRSMERSHGKGAKAGGAEVQLKKKLKEAKQQWKDGVLV